MRIYVGRLPFTSKSADLRRLFAVAGTVAEADIIGDQYSGQSRGFGFVEMPDASEARAAIARFNGYSHHGRKLTVIEATA
jgi:RNA recognition motif-containing protein